MSVVGKLDLKKIRKIQLEELKLIKAFKEVCEKEHLQYFMIGGTMLGAVRHKGFIPWDDDADFMLPREDYDKLIKKAPEYFHGPIRLENYLLDRNYIYYYSKLSTSRIKVEIAGRGKPREENLSIDILPWDGMPKNPVLFWLHPFRVLAMRALYSYSVFEEKVPLNAVRRSKIVKFLVYIGKHVKIGKLFSKDARWHALDNTLKQYPTRRSEWYLHGGGWIMEGMGPKGVKDIYRKDMFGEGAFYEFEGLQLRGPKDYDTYLTQHYGDYMTPPPESERFGHNFLPVGSGDRDT